MTEYHEAFCLMRQRLKSVFDAHNPHLDMGTVVALLDVMNVVDLLVEESSLAPKNDAIDNKILLFALIHEARMRCVLHILDLDVLYSLPMLEDPSDALKLECIREWNELRIRYPYHGKFQQLLQIPLSDGDDVEIALRAMIPPLFTRNG